MKSLHTARGVALLMLLLTFAVSPTRAAEPLAEIPIPAPADWKKERFALPPSFARDMKLKGMEEIRFSPGMYRPQSDEFFSYVIVFRLDGQPALDANLLERELLAYYRGLANAVGGGKIKTDSFSIQVAPTQKPGDESDEKPTEDDVRDYRATIHWIEPFVTKKPQTLRLEARVWKQPRQTLTWAFLSASSKDFDAPIWKQLRDIGNRFYQENQAAADSDSQ